MVLFFRVHGKLVAAFSLAEIELVDYSESGQYVERPVDGIEPDVRIIAAHGSVDFLGLEVLVGACERGQDEAAGHGHFIAGADKRIAEPRGACPELPSLPFSSSSSETRHFCALF